MSTANEFTNFTRPSRLYVGLVLLLWGAFAFFTVVQLFRNDAPPTAGERPQIVPQTEPKAAPAADKAVGHAWPQWRGPQRDGIATETGLRVDWPAGGPPKLWEHEAGEGFSSLAVVQGRIYTMLQDGTQEAIVCWDAGTGQEVWRHRYPARFTHKFGGGPRSSPCVDGDRLYAVGATGTMTCLALGAVPPRVLWSKPLLEEFGAPNIQWGTSFSPLVDGSLVFVAPGGPGGRSLAALDKYTGAIRWQALDDPASPSSPVRAEIASQRQVVFLTGTGLVAVTPEHGTVLWRFPWKTDYDANVGTPVIAGDQVFIATGYGKGCALVKVDKTGQGLTAKLVYKNKRMMSHFTTGVLYQDHIYGFNDSTLTCMEWRSGNVAWTERGFDKGSLTIADGRLFILAEYGTVAVADATPEAYREKTRWSFSTKRSWTAPVIANGRLYLRNEEKIACYDLRK